MFSYHRPRTALLPLLAVGSLAGGVLCAAPANGQLVNGSFEQGNFTGVNMASNHDTTQLFNGDTNITGWTAVNELSWDGDDTTFHVVPSDGRRFLDLTGYHDSQPEGGVQQILTLVPGSSYTLGLDVGYNAMYPSPTVNGVTVSITEAGINQTFDNDGTGSGTLIDSTFWKHYTFNFTPTVATNTLLLQGSAGSSGAFIGLDNVTLIGSVAPTPEPGTFALVLSLGFGSAGCLACRRLRLRKAGRRSGKNGPLYS